MLVLDVIIKSLSWPLSFTNGFYQPNFITIAVGDVIVRHSSLFILIWSMEELEISLSFWSIL